MAGILVVFTAFTMFAEQNGNPNLTTAGADQSISITQSGGNMEGKEVRFGAAGCGLFAGATTGTSTGAVNCMHDSFTPLGGLSPMLHMMFGEISPGGVGVGLGGHVDHGPAGGVHRRVDGRTNAGIPRQEDPGTRDEAGDAVHPGDAVRAAAVRRGVGACCSSAATYQAGAARAVARCSTTSPRAPTTTARRSPTRAPAPSGTRRRRASRC